MAPLLIRCSAIGRLMTDPRNKSEGPLSVGAKTFIRELVAEDVFGVKFEISDKRIDKGRIVELVSIALVNSVRGWRMSKNTERRSNNWITGEADCWDDAGRIGCDIKSAWSLATFPLSADDVAPAQRALYEWQMLGYCWLWGADEWSVQYAMVDTPPHLIGYEAPDLHAVEHIPAHRRVTAWTVKRDEAREDAIAERVEHARAYYAQVRDEFEATHAHEVAA